MREHWQDVQGPGDTGSPGRGEDLGAAPLLVWERGRYLWGLCLSPESAPTDGDAHVRVHAGGTRDLGETTGPLRVSVSLFSNL